VYCPYAAAVGDAQLTLNGVGHSYRGAPHVLIDVDVDLDAGAVLAVHGRNGAGKTTLIRIVAGVLRPRTGRVGRRGRLAYLPQRSDEPPPRMSPSSWFRALAYMSGDGEVAGRVNTLRALGVEHASAPLDTLSVGTVAKVLLAGACGGNSDVLVLDEPFAALDTQARTAALGLLTAAAGRGAIVVVSDHDGAAADIATHVATITSGRLDVRPVTAAAADVRVVAVGRDGTRVEQVVTATERDALLLAVLRDGGSVLHVEDVR
jgi:ABC-type multidrug transport system ATPase subunit